MRRPAGTERDGRRSASARGKRRRIDVQKAITVHMVSDGEGTRGWVHTHGMAAFGLPELEIRNMPLFMCTAAGAMINRVADYMLNSGKAVREGEPMQIGMSVLVLRAESSIPGAEEHFATPRWRLQDHPGMVGACGCESHGHADDDPGHGRN